MNTPNFVALGSLRQRPSYGGSFFLQVEQQAAAERAGVPCLYIRWDRATVQVRRNF